MKRSILNRISILGCCIAFLMTAFAAHTAAQLLPPRAPQNSANGGIKTEIARVHVFGSTTVVPQAGASLIREKEGVLGSISTSGLTPGHVVTLWWAIFNNPEFCAVPGCAPSDFNNPLVNGSLQFGGGTIADAGGRVSFSGYLGVGDSTGAYDHPMFPNIPNPSPGIVDTKKATIHLAIRTHGLPNPDPVIFNQQLTTFPGGCSVAVPPCATVQAAMFFGSAQLLR